MNKLLILFLFLSLAFNGVCQSNLVHSEGTLEDRFPKRIGDMRFSETTHHLGVVFNNEDRVDTIRTYNSSDRAISISGTMKIPTHMKLDIQPLKLSPKEEGMMIISYSAAERKEFGFVFDRILLQTDDPLQPEKNINITATIKEYFPPLDPADSALVQKARVPEKIYNFGRIQQGEKSLHDFLIINDGQAELLVHHSKTTCGCIRTSFSKNIVAPGDSSIVTVEFDSFGKEGENSQEVTVYVNDRSQPEIRFSINGEVWK